MKERMRKGKIRRDKDGYEPGGPDMSQTRILRGKERETVLRRVKRGPLKRFLNKITA